MPDWLLVGIGGGLGSIARYGVSQYAAKLSAVPLGTTLVNALGSLAIGVMLPLLGRLPPFARPFFIIGFLGGFTTMSSYAAEVVTLASERQFAAAASTWVAGAVGCGLLCAAGYWIGLRLR